MSHVVIWNLNTEHPSWTANMKITQGLFDGDPNIWRAQEADVGA